MEENPYKIQIENLLKEKKSIEIINFINEDDKYIFHFSFLTYPIKMTTDFEVFSYFESEIISLEDLNLKLISSVKKSPEYIINILSNHTLHSNFENKIVLKDTYNFYQKIEEVSKFVINYDVLEKESKVYRESKNVLDVSKFPKELLFNPNQIYQVISRELKNINQNMSFNHFISPINNNPYNLSLKLKLNNPILKKIKESLGYDYIELKINIEPKIYPFYPPKFEFIKPAIKLPLVHNLLNLKILKMENWNPTISLEWLILNLANKLESIIQDYLILDEIKFPELNTLLIKLASMTKETTENIFEIEFNKIESEIKKEDKFWKSGVGYGYEGRKSWDIASFVKEQEIKSTELSILLNNINTLINADNLKEIYDSNLSTFLINKITGLTLLELDKNPQVYIEILNILEKFTIQEKNQEFINKMSTAFINIADDISCLFQSTPQAQDNEFYIKIHCIGDWYLTNKKENLTKQLVVVDINNKKEYEETMKKLQFDYYEIPKNHRFYSEIDKKIEKKSIMRIISEVSGFKTGLPLNYDSTIWVRVSKKNINVFSFFISGPKDTPYENGIFEFHASFPSNYPENVPLVLIDTTGGGSVRFNPNLYACGKVCLSILNTWSGEASEKWNPSTSTFLQVLVSIQSLILVEKPYFNEPGWERQMHTAEGKAKSDNYNEPLYIGTIKHAIIDMITKPPNGMEEVIKKHFIIKKDEIISNTAKWIENCSSKNKQILELARNEMITLLNTL